MVKRRQYFAPVWSILKDAVRELANKDLFRMAGATAFFTTFALPAIIMIIVRTLGLFADRKTVGRHLGTQLRKIFGDQTMDSLRQVIRSFVAMQHNYFITTATILFLVFVATTLFKIIKGSINELWNIRARSTHRFNAMLKSRAVSILVILLGGVLFFAVELVVAGQHLANGNTQTASLLLPSWLFTRAITIFISAVWFYVLFMFMPDGKPSGKIAAGGALVTGLLFNLGKWIIGFLLSPGRVNSFYGASGAIVLLLLFVFYSSIILYFGAAIVKAWSDASGVPIRPKPHAVKYRIELEDDPS